MSALLVLLLSLSPWLEKVLEGDDERAAAVLVRKGTPALKELEEAREKADPAARKRLEKIIRTIRAREPEGLLFCVGLPKMRLTRDSRVTFVVSVRNRGEKTRVLYPLLSLRLFDAQGNEVKPARKLGRGGLRRGHPLDAVEFVTLKPGETWRFEADLAQYGRDPKWITGWKTPPPGTYAMEFTYAFDRERADGLDAEHPAHEAVAMKHVFTQELRIAP